MPELPEVETVRRGLARVAGLTVKDVEILNPRSIREHQAGARDFQKRLRGQTFEHISRRGKFLWLPTAREEALVIHLGMTGQALLQKSTEPQPSQTRVRLEFRNTDLELRFVDQRMFGGMLLDDLQWHGEERLPRRASHIARDLLDPLLDLDEVISKMRKRQAGIKSVLLNQEIVSGFGNIYADEALWQAKVHYLRPTASLARAQIREVLQAGQEVMARALQAGGTSFDALYVDVNGESGWFQVDLNAYGQEGEPCPRCARPIVREHWSNRSSFRCPRCQPRPRSL